MMSQRGIQLKKVQEEGFKLFEKKNQDYGDAFATYGTVGILVRIGDKIHRLQSITSKGINLVEDEKLRDTLILEFGGIILSIDSFVSPQIVCTLNLSDTF